MQDSSSEVTAQGQKIEIHEAPSQELLQEICLFVNTEADWNISVFDLSVTEGTFAVVRGTDNKLVGVSSTHGMSRRNLWLANVCVAKNARRSGLGSIIVSTLLKRASEKKVRSHIVLIAAKLGEGVYRRLGFEDVQNVSIFWYDRPPLPAPSKSALSPSLPKDQNEHEDAIDLEKEAGGIYRGKLLKAVFEKDRMCAMLECEDSVVAAAWGRYKALVPSTNLPTLHIGPVVAKSPEFATSVIAEVLRMDQAKHAGTRDSCIRTTALVVRIGDNDASERAFESLGFVKKERTPFLQKGLVPEADPLPSSVDLAVANEQCYAITWWDIP